MLLKCVLCASVILSIMIGPSRSNSDNLALLVSTLRTKNKAACDGELVTLSCPTGTSITIQVAQYGSKVPEGHICTNRNGGRTLNSEGCEWPNSMQYSLLQTVVEACQKKQRCKFSTRPKPGLTDPCPSARKYVEVAYKCRPNEFRSQTACEGESISLGCNPFSRVAIFDAQFGRAPSDSYTQQSTTCPQMMNAGTVNQICLAPHAVETAMQICHGKRRCKLKADTKSFGKPCKPDTVNLLKVVYTCVPFDILSEKYESLQDEDEIMDGSSVIGFHDKVGLFDESDKSVERWTDPTFIPPPVYKYPEIPESPEDVKETTTGGYENSVRVIQDSSQDISTKASKSSIFVYTGAALFILILFIIILIGIRYLIIRRRSKVQKTEDMYTTDIPNVFDRLSDVDNDVDISHISGTFYEHPDMILFKDTPGEKGMRAMRPLSSIYPSAGASMYGVDYVQSRELSDSRLSKPIKEDDVVMSPKSLEKFANSQFYYG